ncbi:Na+/H+ antiporter subunit E [Actinoallomurus rhizosphaericola]|uniref:Na+/H+ antiporter subunit E n=1 Tax=Actinoallomurus rhizosphaericola TaxID=2952536 RepID=UPI002091FB67|nr:Na+/H+ antiporter subunit E [Actinoallomurus rhizosphaericola]MCO5997153.1 Na+/H+ antiporter subunit E [Actinoallomurus rhizosphaericola]
MVWWAALYVVYLGIISTVSVTELVVGAVAAAFCATAAVATRRALLTDLAIARPRLRVLLLLPPQIVRDSVVLLRPARHGRFAEVPMPSDHDGVLTLLLSLSPGTYVTRVRPDRNAVQVHRTEDRSSPVERELTSC